MANLTDNITSEKQLRNIVREEVTAALKQFTDDPDTGLQVNPEFEKKLKTAAGVPDEDLIPFSENSSLKAYETSKVS